MSLSSILGKNLARRPVEVVLGFIAKGKKNSDGNPIRVIMTIPHARCIDDPYFLSEHYCDITALSNAERFAEILRGRGIIVIFLPGDTLRPNCDLNRDRCRETPYRKMVRSFMREYPDASEWDIHSKPHGGPRRSDKNEVYLLDDTPVGSPQWEKSQKVVDALLAAEIDADLYKGEKNSIINDGVEAGLPSFLVEFDESLTPERRDEILYVLADVIEEGI